MTSRGTEDDAGKMSSGKTGETARGREQKQRRPETFQDQERFAKTLMIATGVSVESKGRAGALLKLRK